MEEVLRLHEFFIEGGNPEESHVLLHITEPSTAAEEAKGHFFALCEVQRGTPDYIEQLETAIEGAEKSYYEAADEEPERALEKALDLVNKQSSQLLKPYLSLHIAVGVVVKSTIIFSFYGTPHINLYYKTREGGYKILDLVRENTPEAGAAVSAGMFSQIIQGKITSGDYLLAATPGSTATMPPEQLKQLITTRSPKESTGLIERSLRGVPSDRSYGGLILHLAPPAPRAVASVKTRSLTRGSQESLQQFFSTEQKTNQTLSSSLGNHLGNKLQNGLSNLQHAPSHQRSDTRSRTDDGEETNFVPPRSRDRYERQSRGTAIAGSLGRGILIGASYIGKALLKIISLIGDFFITIIHTIGNFFVVCTNFRNRRSLVLDGWARTWRGYKEHFYQLPILTKIMFLLALVLIGVFVGSILHIRKTHQQAEDARVYQEKVQAIKTNLSNAEGALVYNNTLTATNELATASSSLLALDCQLPERESVCAPLLVSLSDLRARARRLVTVEPSLVTTFEANGYTEPKLTKLNTLLLVFSPSTSSIFSYNLLTKESKYLSTTSTGFIASAVPKENDYALFVNSDRRFVELNPKDNTLKTVSVGLPANAGAISGLIVYNRRLYTLDDASGQLYRHDVIRSGFGPGREWIKSSLADTQHGVSVAIDGDIFIATAQGAISKFTNGLKQDFAIQGLDPALGNLARIWTYNDLNYFYILDPAEKRLIITDKTGRLVKQLTSPLFSHPTDMVVDEASKNAFIVDTDKLYKIDLPL